MKWGRHPPLLWTACLQSRREMSAVQACLVAKLAACSTKVSLALRRRNQISKRRLLSPQHSVRPRSAICMARRGAQ